MAVATGIDWRKALGLAGRTVPAFFSDASALDSRDVPVPQAHALRRAFDLLQLDGILCQNNAPITYFKEVERLDPAWVTDLHRQFWNQGLAPLLVLITPDEVHVYSALSTPPSHGEAPDEAGRLVTKLNRVADAAELRQFALTVESGELFHKNAKSFDPKKRVDRTLLRNLTAAREAMAKVSPTELEPRTLDNLLCRVVFACYLFDRKVIDGDYLRGAGIEGAAGIRELVRGRRDQAVERLYLLFKKLGEDFNGDLFGDDLDTEAAAVTGEHLRILSRFLAGADVATGQGSFWPYDFAVIPIETISAIYEHFLKAADADPRQPDDPDERKQKGAFYTPRFLAEIVLDLALEGMGTILDKRFLDSACGSGIFLVGLFNRLADEWSRRHEGASYAERADGLLTILKSNLLGVDENPTACRIAAFSLYLAFLDQLKPSHIQALQRKKRFLPRLVFTPGETGRNRGQTICCGDFFQLPAAVDERRFDAAVGNPPWASISGPLAAAEQWCQARSMPIANRQLALAFVWKAAEHMGPGGRACVVLPNGVLFNHQRKAIEFQKAWFQRHAVDLVLNLSDFQRFLFDKAEFPAIVARYAPAPHGSDSTRIQYLSPKTDWSVSHAEIITVAAQDRTTIAVRDLLADLRDERGPLPWKLDFWATPRDQKLLERLRLFPRLGEITGQPRQRHAKRWLAAQGFKPEKDGQQCGNSKPCPWPDEQLFLDADSAAIALFVVEFDSSRLAGRFRWLHRLPAAGQIFQPPHVLVTHGLHVAYCDYPVVFRHALQGIHGPAADRSLLIFLAAYLHSPLARFFLFHTTSSWGVSRAEVHLEELLTAPFPLPEQTPDPKRSRQIVAEVVKVVDGAMARARQPLIDRRELVRRASERIEPLIYEYFDVDDVERALVEDTNAVVIPSTRPAGASLRVPTLVPPSPAARTDYVRVLCSTLNDWAAGGRYHVEGRVLSSSWSGIGALELRKAARLAPHPAETSDDDELLAVLDRLQRTYRKQLGSVELLRGVRVFDNDTLYLFKPLQLRYWTRSAALNDADGIAASILSRPARERA